MRELIVKYFALDYVFKAFGMSLTVTRSSTFIYPLFAITGISWVGDFNMYITVLFALLTLICLFFGFVYFQIFPVQYKELDYLQKYAFIEFRIKNDLDFPEEYHHNEYFPIVKIISNIEDRRFYKPFLYFTFHPLFQSFFWLTIGYFILTN